MEKMANYHNSKNLGEIQMGSRKSSPGHFEVYEVEVRADELGGLPGVIGWMGEPLSL